MRDLGPPVRLFKSVQPLLCLVKASIGYCTNTGPNVTWSAFEPVFSKDTGGSFSRLFGRVSRFPFSRTHVVRVATKTKKSASGCPLERQRQGQGQRQAAAQGRGKSRQLALGSSLSALPLPSSYT